MRQETGVPRNKLIRRLKSGGIGRVAPLLQPVPSMHKALGSTFGMADFVVTARACRPSTWEVEGGRSQVCLWLHGEFEASLGYMKSHLRIKQ